MSIGLAVLLILFNVVGVPYPALFDNLLIAFSFVFSAFNAWQAWTWS